MDLVLIHQVYYCESNHLHCKQFSMGVADIWQWPVSHFPVSVSFPLNSTIGLDAENTFILFLFVKGAPTQNDIIDHPATLHGDPH